MYDTAMFTDTGMFSVDMIYDSKHDVRFHPVKKSGDILHKDTNELNIMFEHIVTDPYYQQSYGTITTVLKPKMKPPIIDEESIPDFVLFLHG
jgi:hypothetical protein